MDLLAIVSGSQQLNRVKHISKISFWDIFQKTHYENYEEKQNNGFSNNFFYNTPKEYKASTLDWLAGQARI